MQVSPSGPIRRLTMHSFESIHITETGEDKGPPSSGTQGAPPGRSVFETVIGQGRDLWSDGSEFYTFLKEIYERQREDAKR